MTDTRHMRYPALVTLAQVYFSEDWPDFYDDDPMVAVDAFLRGHPGSSAQLAHEIDEILSAEPTEDQLAALFRQIELLYNPPEMDGYRYRDWLTAVADMAKGMHQRQV